MQLLLSPDAGLCSKNVLPKDVDAWDLGAVSSHPDLLDVFVQLVNTIVRTLKSINS